jgi:hypothetical protein
MCSFHALGHLGSRWNLRCLQAARSTHGDPMELDHPRDDVSRVRSPRKFSALSPEANALIEAKVKGQEQTLSDYLPGSADARSAWDEISSQSQGGAEAQR